MRFEVERELNDSAHDFLHLVWPMIKPVLGGGEIEAVEAVTDEKTTERLDWLAGIDAWHYLADDGGMRGVASRVQWWRRSWERSWPWRTFTVRRSLPSGRPTEWDKRLAALRQSHLGLLYPHLTVQAYVRKRGAGPVDSIGIVRTFDLIEYIESHDVTVRTAAGGVTFFHVGWDELRTAGVDVRELPKKTTTAQVGSPGIDYCCNDYAWCGDLCVKKKGAA